MDKFWNDHIKILVISLPNLSSVSSDCINIFSILKISSLAFEIGHPVDNVKSFHKYYKNMCLKLDGILYFWSSIKLWKQ